MKLEINTDYAAASAAAFVFTTVFTVVATEAAAEAAAASVLISSFFFIFDIFAPQCCCHRYGRCHHRRLLNDVNVDIEAYL